MRSGFLEDVLIVYKGYMFICIIYCFNVFVGIIKYEFWERKNYV